MFFTVLLSSLMFLSGSLCNQVNEAKFIKEQLHCNATYRISEGCSKKTPTSKTGLLHCLSLCSLKDDCTGASLDDLGKCLHHQVCAISSGACQQVSPPQYYMSEYCVHGTWNYVSQECDCVNEATGPRCNEFPKDCVAVKEAGFSGGRRFINPSLDGRTIYSVNCSFGSQGVDTYVFYNEGTPMWNRTWEEYASGFFVDNYNFWLGLRAWHELCKNECGELRLKARSTFVSFWGKNEGFVIEDESNNFRFSFNTSGGDDELRDCLNPLRGIPFSTWDRDSDEDSRTNCAARAGSGWWYSGCDTPCNLLGLGNDHWSSTPQYQHAYVLWMDYGIVGFDFKDSSAFFRKK